MKSSPKVLFVAPCLAMGGMERAAVNTANGLQNAGCQVIFLSLFKKVHFFSLNDEITLLEPCGFNEKSLSLLKSVFWIRKEIKKYQPTHVLSFNKLYGAITAFSLLGIDISLFISERSSPFFKWKFPLNVVNRLAYKLNPPKGVIAQTKIAAKYQSKYFKKSQIKVIPNSVREVRLYPEVARQTIILAVGRLNDHLKGFDLLLEAIAKIKNENWKLCIAGGNEDGQALKKMAVLLGIQDRVSLLGRVTEIDQWYAKAGIFVIPSRSEGFPNALLEAMAAGCPSIAFDFVAGPREIITHNENGIIVESGNTMKLAQAIDELIENKELRNRLGKEAMKVRDNYNSKRICRQITDYIFE